MLSWVQVQDLGRAGQSASVLWRRKQRRSQSPEEQKVPGQKVPEKKKKVQEQKVPGLKVPGLELTRPGSSQQRSLLAHKVLQAMSKIWIWNWRHTRTEVKEEELAALCTSTGQRRSSRCSEEVPHRSRVVPVPPGADHAAQDLQAVGADVPGGAEALLGHVPAVDHHAGAAPAHGHVQLEARGTGVSRSAAPSRPSHVTRGHVTLWKLP